MVNLEEAALAALQAVEHERAAGIDDAVDEEDVQRRMHAPPNTSGASRQLSRSMSSSIQRCLALMQLDAGTSEQILRANQDAPAHFRTTSYRSASRLRPPRSLSVTAPQARFYSTPASEVDSDVLRFTQGEEGTGTYRVATSVRSDYGPMFRRTLSISADGGTSSQPPSQPPSEWGAYQSAMVPPSPGTFSYPSRSVYSGPGSRSGGSGPGSRTDTSRSHLSGPGSRSGGSGPGSRSGSGSRGTTKTSSWGSRTLMHNQRSLTGTAVREEAGEGEPGAGEGTIEWDDPYAAHHQPSRLGQVVEAPAEGVETPGAEGGSLQHRLSQASSTTEGAAAGGTAAGVARGPEAAYLPPLVPEPGDVPTLSAPPPSALFRRSNRLNLDMAEPLEETPLVDGPEVVSPAEMIVQRTNSWLQTQVRAPHEDAEEAPPPPSELQLSPDGSPVAALTLDLPPPPPVPDLQPDHLPTPGTRTIALFKLSRLSRITTPSSPPPGVVVPWAGDDEGDEQAHQAAAGEPQHSSAPVSGVDAGQGPSDAPPSSLTAPSNFSSVGTTSYGTSSSSEGVGNPPSDGQPAADDDTSSLRVHTGGGGGASAADDFGPATPPAPGTPTAGPGQRILRLNPWAPLPGPCLQTVVAAQQVAMLKGSRSLERMRTVDSLRLRGAAGDGNGLRTRLSAAPTSGSTTEDSGEGAPAKEDPVVVASGSGGGDLTNQLLASAEQ